MVHLIRPIEFQDMLRLRRWCSGTSTRWSEIRVRIDGGQGGLIESEAFWIDINRDTGMPSRLGDVLDELHRTTDVHRLRWTRPIPVFPLLARIPVDRGSQTD